MINSEKSTLVFFEKVLNMYINCVFYVTSVTPSDSVAVIKNQIRPGFKIKKIVETGFVKCNEIK